MEALKGIETNDKEEKAALGFLNIDKTKWDVKEKNDEMNLTYSTIKMENPLTNAEEEKVVFCLDVTLKKPVQTVLKCLNDFNLRKKFDTLYSEGKLVSEKKENPEVYNYYLLLKMGFVFSDRDFVLQKKVWKDYRGNKDHVLIHVSSINLPEYPEQSKPVRGVFLNRACYLYPGGNDQETKMTLCNCVDMKMMDVGTIMTVKKGSEGMQSWLDKFKKALEEA